MRPLYILAPHYLITKTNKHMKLIKIFAAMLVLAAITALGYQEAKAQTWTDVTGNKRHLGLQNFTQGTTITTAQFSITGAGDTLWVVTRGDSTYLEQTNKVHVQTPVFVVSGFIDFGSSDSATIYATEVKRQGYSIYCTDCTPTNNSSGGCLVTWTGSLWRRNW